MRLKITEIASAIGGEIVRGDISVEVTGISTDTRQLHVGDLFVALIGENNDGHLYLEDAAGQGASGIIVSRDVKGALGNIPVIKVKDTLYALGELAKWYLRQADVRVAAVTGSVGKTTTKEMAACVLEAKAPTLKNAGNYNNEIGLPLTIFELKPEHRFAVLEMAMRGPGEIDRLAEIAEPEAGIITNIGISHIERLGSIEAIANAKGELFARLPESGIALMEAGNEWWDFLSKKAKCRVMGFGFSEKAEVRGSDLETDDRGCPIFNVWHEGKSARVRLSAPGEHNAINALAAIALGLAFGVSLNDSAERLRNCSLPEMRMKVSTTANGITVVDDTYNASPASMAAALRLMRTLRGDRKVAILGDMLELGKESESAHREIGELAVESGASLLICVGERAAGFAEGARYAGLPEKSIYKFESSEEATKVLRPLLQSGDVVLIKGSRMMKMELIVEALLAE